jgi:uncharacterized protein DUF3359
MSDVPRIACTICNPSAADVQGIRRPVTVTNSELTELMRHMLVSHSPATTTANQALETAQRALDVAKAAQATAAGAEKTASRVSGYTDPQG